MTDVLPEVLEAERALKAAELAEFTASIETAGAQLALANQELERLERLRRSVAFSTSFSGSLVAARSSACSGIRTRGSACCAAACSGASPSTSPSLASSRSRFAGSSSNRTSPAGTGRVARPCKPSSTPGARTGLGIAHPATTRPAPDRPAPRRWACASTSRLRSRPAALACRRSGPPPAPGADRPRRCTPGRRPSRRDRSPRGARPGPARGQRAPGLGVDRGGSGLAHLAHREGHVGDVMYDSALYYASRAEGRTGLLDSLGLIPGAGGTQRLPRLVGLGNALYLIQTGAVIGWITNIMFIQG